MTDCERCFPMGKVATENRVTFCEVVRGRGQWVSVASLRIGLLPLDALEETAAEDRPCV